MNGGEDGPARPLDRRRALVVGASRGIGAAVARRLADDGATLTLVARSLEDLRTVAAGLPGHGHTVHPCDLRDGPARAALLEAVPPDGTDIVVSGLRTRHPWRTLRRSNSTAFAAELISDTAYLVDLVAALLPAQRDAGFGRWILISSAVASIGGVGQGAYVAQKCALEGLARTLALEEGRHGITANVVAPGFVTTEGTQSAYAAEVRDALGSANALGRPGRVDEVAHVVGMLAAPAAGFVTGATIPVSGGAELGWALAGASAVAGNGSAPSPEEEIRAGLDAG